MKPREGEFSSIVSTTPAPPHAVRWFARWVAGSVDATTPLLNIGAGRNLSGGLRPVRQRAGRIVGIDPDPSIWDNPGCDELHQQTLEQFAVEHPAQFDVAMSVFVLEHVADPPMFIAACARVLKPGGSLFGLTVHKYHYFGMCTWATTRLHVADRLLVALKGQEVVEGYHFPTEYRMNTTRRISRLLAEAGFSSVEFRMFDKPDLYAWYLPDRIKPVAPAWSRMVYRLNTPQLMGTLSFRAVR
jgi:SAM-dependent methyltransferase